MNIDKKSAKELTGVSSKDGYILTEASSDFMKNVLTNFYDTKSNDNQSAIDASIVLVSDLYIPGVDFDIASDTVAD